MKLAMISSVTAATLFAAPASAIAIWEVGAQSTATVQGSALGPFGGLGTVYDDDSQTFSDSLLFFASSTSQIFGGLAQGDAYARGSLQAASLGVRAGGTHVRVPDGNGNCCYEWRGGGLASAHFRDRLVFQIEGAALNERTPIKVEFYASGSLGGSDVQWGYNLALTQGARSILGGEFESLGGVPWENFAFGFSSVSYSALNNSRSHFAGLATYELAGPAATVDVFSELYLRVAGGGYSDFSGTAAMRFILPDNVTISSASGVFLSEPYLGRPAAVPEPATWALMMCGFALVGAGMRRRGYRVAFV